MSQLESTEDSILDRSVGNASSRRAVPLLAMVTAAFAAVWLAHQIVSCAETAELAPPQAVGETPPSAAPAATEVSSRICGVRRHRRCGILRAGSRLLKRIRRDRSRIYVARPAAKPDPYAWKDLFDGKTLEGWSVPEFGGEGEVYVKDDAIVMEMGATMTGITCTSEVIKNDYELTLEGSRVDGIDFFCTTTFPVDDESCSLVVGGWGGTVVGLSCVDYYDASDNFTTTFHSFEDKQWYKIRIRVTSAKIEAWIDDEQVVDQEREGHQFTIRDEVDLCRPLGVSAWCTTGAVRKIRIRKLPPPDTEGSEPQQQ